MKRVHLLAVTDSADTFQSLAAELEARGERMGWLDWRPADEPPPMTGGLAAAATLPGLLRAVTVNAGRQQVVKPVRGAPVLKDVLREHFRGCRVVLVRGEIGGQAEAPALAPAGAGFEISLGKDVWRLSAAALADRLRKPRPFASHPENSSPENSSRESSSPASS